MYKSTPTTKHTFRMIPRFAPWRRHVSLDGDASQCISCFVGYSNMPTVGIDWKKTPKWIIPWCQEQNDHANMKNISLKVLVCWHCFESGTLNLPKDSFDSLSAPIFLLTSSFALFSSLCSLLVSSSNPWHFGWFVMDFRFLIQNNQHFKHI